jgi:hypothetical protein
MSVSPMKLQDVCSGCSTDRSLVVMCGSVTDEVINELLSWTGADISQQKFCSSTLFQNKKNALNTKRRSDMN